MMRNERKDYKDCSEWLSALKEDDAWKSQKAQLMAPNANMKKFRRKALERIGNGVTYHLWDIYQHNIKPVVEQLWVFVDLSLPKMMIQVLGMLTLEWIEQHPELERACADTVLDVERITPEKGDASFINTHDPKNILPPRLRSPQAMEYWHKLQVEGFLNDNYKPAKKTTRGQLWFIAKIFCQKMDMSISWEPFEVLFGKGKLAQEGSKFNMFGKNKLHCKKIEHIFGITLNR